MLYDYEAIYTALGRCQSILKEERDFLASVKADPDLIAQYKSEIEHVEYAKDIIFRYQDLES